MPIFEDVEGEQRRATEEAFAAGHWHQDEESAAEAAYDEGIAQAIMFMEMRTVFIATGVAGLFHLLEKQLYRFLNDEIGRYRFMIRRKKQDVPLVIGKWEDAEALIKAFPVILRIWGDGRTLIDAITSRANIYPNDFVRIASYDQAE
jgi:hypothetical protein